MWGDEPPDAGAAALRVRVSQLRKALGPEGNELLVTRPPGYALRVEPEQVDLRRFERLVAAGERALADGDPRTAVERLREALALWRGPPLADFAYAPFAPGRDRAAGGAAAGGARAAHRGRARARPPRRAGRRARGARRASTRCASGCAAS